MITHVTQSEFIDTFRQSELRKNNFSYDGLIALFEYLEEYEDSTGEQINFDMIAICCDYSEYRDLEEFINDYQDYAKDWDKALKDWPPKAAYENLILALREQTEVIEFEGKTNKVHPISNCYSLKPTPDKSFIIRAF